MKKFVMLSICILAIFVISVSYFSNDVLGKAIIKTREGRVQQVNIITCGNGEIGANEECDDNNRVDQDGCSASCRIEEGYWCGAEPSYCELNKWKKPIGVAVPEFGIEQKHTMYSGRFFEAGQFNYRDNGNGPYSHYIDNSQSCTDTNNPFGTANHPRCTIPINLPEGSVVEVHGGPYDYSMGG